MRLELPPGWRSEPAVAPFEMQQAGQEQNIAFQVFPSQLEQKTYSVTAVAEFGGRQYREGFDAVGYPGLRPYNLYMPATYKTTGVDCKIAPGLRVGYVTGTGDAVPQSLASIGVKTDFPEPERSGARRPAKIRSTSSCWEFARTQPVLSSPRITSASSTM